MERNKVGIEFFITAFVAMVASALLLIILHQQEMIDAACVAIENYAQEDAESYIDQVWDINGCGLRKETMLMVACEVGNEEAIEYLLNKGADPNKTVAGNLTPLELFCRDGYNAGERALLLLLNAGVRQSIYTVKPAIFHLADNYYWMTDEQKALATEETIWLLKYGAPLGYKDTSLLHLAAKSNMADLFYTIVHTREGLYMINMRDGDGNTPWSVAVINGAVDVQRVIRNLETESEEEQEENATTPSNPLSPSEP